MAKPVRARTKDSRGPLDGANDLGQPGLVYAVGPGREHQYGFVACHRPEDQRLHYLRNVAADSGGGFGRGPRALGHLDHLARDSELL